MAAPALRQQFRMSVRDLSKELVQKDCTLSLLQCGIIFNHLPEESSDGVLPSVDDLKLLHEKFDQIWANTHERNRNAATLGQWSKLFAKCGHLPSHQEVLDLLLQKTAALLDRIPLNAQAIGNILYNLKKTTSGKGAKAVLRAIVRHIQSAEQLTPQHIGMGLYGLQNMTESEETKAVLQAMVRHVKNAEQLAPEEIGMGLYGLQNMTDSAETKAVLQAMAWHIKSGEQWAAQYISMGLYGLQNMTENDGTKAVLQAMVRHIKNARQLKPQEISMTLYGLHSLGSSEGAKTVLAALIPHVSKMDPHRLPGSGSAAEYLAEVIYSVEPHFSSQEQDVAERLLTILHQRLASGLRERADLPLPEGSLADPKSRRHAIFILLRHGGHIYPNRRSHNGQDEWVIDLHRLSHALGATFCETALQSLDLGIALPLNIVYGRSSHKAANQGKMRAAVESVLAKREFSNLAIDDSQEGYLRVTRGTPGANRS